MNYIQSKALIKAVPTKGNITQNHSGKKTKNAAVKINEITNPIHHIAVLGLSVVVVAVLLIEIKNFQQSYNNFKIPKHKIVIMQ